ncbi:hypothetical protein BDR06DRAFT_976699 [Suillus hirtellus]|nr:hypothetical protein BDR06DRAFT_976699 [Suillus hirtellus]
MQEDCNTIKIELPTQMRLFKFTCMCTDASKMPIMKLGVLTDWLEDQTIQCKSFLEQAGACIINDSETELESEPAPKDLNHAAQVLVSSIRQLVGDPAGMLWHHWGVFEAGLGTYTWSSRVVEDTSTKDQGASMHLWGVAGWFSDTLHPLNIYYSVIVGLNITITKWCNQLKADIIKALQCVKCVLQHDLLLCEPKPLSLVELEYLDNNDEEAEAGAETGDAVDEEEGWDILLLGDDAEDMSGVETDI